MLVLNSSAPGSSVEAVMAATTTLDIACSQQDSSRIQHAAHLLAEVLER